MRCVHVHVNVTVYEVQFESKVCVASLSKFDSLNFQSYMEMLTLDSAVDSGCLRAGDLVMKNI